MAKRMTLFLKLKSLLISLIEKYHPFNIRSFKILVVIMMTVLSVSVLILGWMSSRKVREVVTEDFNQQQLVLARHAASQIENRLNVLKRELLLLSLSPSIQYVESPFMHNRMEIAFSSIKDEGVMGIIFIENETIKTHVVDNLGYRVVRPSPEEMQCLELCKKEENKGNIQILKVLPIEYGNVYKKLIMKMFIPVWQISTDETHPVAKNKFSGTIMFFVDVTKLAEKVTKGIRSGKTGYAWVLDEKGIFLFHHEKDFIGKNAFEVRKGKKPTISFTRINEIQKEKMLKGEEGTSWYISGWHRGIEGEIKKLIAYAPVKLDDTNKAEHIWSVAVVAPVSEVEGAIHSIHTQQFSLQAIIIFVILFGGLLVNFMILSWSNLLEKEVEEKTEEIRKAHEQLIHSEKLASLGRMAGGVAHEINNPLTGIVTFGHLLLKRFPEGSQEREDIEVIIEQANRCANIIKGLLGFARATSAEKIPVGINGIVNSSLDMVRHKADFFDIKFVLNFDEALPPVKANASQVQQVFLNMLINAADAMEGKGTLTISTRKVIENGKPFAEVEFTDTGHGIPEENISKLFEPFFTTKPVGKGVGLGLAVSHGIIQDHGGEILVKSKVGEGTSFFAKLPFYEE